MKKTILILLFLIIKGDHSIIADPPAIINKNVDQIIQFNRYNIDSLSVEYVMAGIAYHECFNLSYLDRWLTMEAFYNRLKINFNNNGTTVRGQLLAPKQFTGLFKYNPEQFKFDSSDTICQQNLVMAREIVNGNRVSNKTIVYWAGKSCDKSTLHWKLIYKNRLNLPNYLKQIYSTQ